MFGACGGDPSPADESADRAQVEVSADSSTLLAQQKMYLSFEVTLKGERKFGERVPADALTDIAWRVSHSVKGEMVLDMPLPGSVPPSIASDDSMEMMEEGRYIGWTAALPDDPDFIEKMTTGELDVANNPMFVPVEFRIDHEEHHHGRDFPSDPFGMTLDQTIKGRGKAYVSKSVIVSCDLKMKICDISGLLGSGYTDSTDLVTIAEMSSYPGDQGKSRTMGPGLLLPKFAGTLDNRLAGIKFQSSGPITTSFSEPYRENYQPLGSEAALVVTVSVTVSPSVR
jgi:hypothetical protein